MSQSSDIAAADTTAKNDLLLKLFIPFCYHKCSYCGLPVCSYDDKVIQAHCKAMQSEIEAAAAEAEDSVIRAISIEGGSPVLASPYALQDLLRCIRRNFVLAEDVQISLQTMPGEYSRNLIQRMRDCGVNFWTIGLETAEPAEHELLERPYRFDALTMVDTAIRTFDMRDLSFELLYGIPGQTMRSWQHSLDAVLAYGPEHLTLTPLQLIPGTLLADRCLRGEVTPCAPETAAEFYEYARELLTSMGYRPYTVYDFARPGHENRYRLALLQGTPYLGFGYQADSYIDGVCYTNGHSLREYIEHSPELPIIANHMTRLDDKAGLLRYITSRLTLAEGLDPQECERLFGSAAGNLVQNILPDLVKKGILSEAAGTSRDSSSYGSLCLTAWGIASGELNRLSL